MRCDECGGSIDTGERHHLQPELILGGLPYRAHSMCAELAEHLARHHKGGNIPRPGALLHDWRSAKLFSRAAGSPPEHYRQAQVMARVIHKRLVAQGFRAEQTEIWR